MNDLPTVALDSAAAGIEPTTSSRQSNTHTTLSPSCAIWPNKMKSLYGLFLISHPRKHLLSARVPVFGQMLIDGYWYTAMSILSV